jgi:hypothetical protein
MTSDEFLAVPCTKGKKTLWAVMALVDGEAVPTTGDACGAGCAARAALLHHEGHGATHTLILSVAALAPGQAR